MKDTDKIDLLIPYERLHCYRCLEMKVSADKRYAWCEIGQKDFPMMCEKYRGTNG